jgi:hypothetical protein
MIPLEFRKALAGVDLHRETFLRLLSLLEEEGESIPLRRRMKLVKLVCRLKSHACMALTAVDKRELFGNLLDLVKQGQEEWTGRVCWLVHGGRLPPKRGPHVLPEEMVGVLVKLVNTERSERVREILWTLLLRRGIRLETFVGTTDVISGLSENNPVIRNKMARFLFDHFRPDQVLEAALQHSLIGQRKIPGVALNRYAGLLTGKEALEHKKLLLAEILDSCEIEDEEIDRVWSDYLRRLNRFDLIRATSPCNSGAKWLSELKRKSRQMAFAFNDQAIIPSSHEGFRERICAMMNCRMSRPC